MDVMISLYDYPSFFHPADIHCIILFTEASQGVALGIEVRTQREADA